MSARTAAVAAARIGGATAEYVACFAPAPGDLAEEPGFPPEMPFYFRHTSRFNSHLHARALMRLRCCSTPFAACPTLHTGADPRCRHCAAAAGPESAEHALLDCPAYAGLRSDPRFAPLFAGPATAPPALRLRALA